MGEISIWAGMTIPSKQYLAYSLQLIDERCLPSLFVETDLKLSKKLALRTGLRAEYTSLLGGAGTAAKNIRSI